ncbi:MAG: ATP-binding protein [Polaromonas sp.]|uniref:GAF domain-containing sensor histidine kinase n=1 Tax=Polaromonas sp. TaxID=1869339 RepID=UPI002489D87A|nr:ATP-binding protein [Polaromonas sp.]MDI1236648.1 ATP-binding protein [Polaromonas sp.]
MLTPDIPHNEAERLSALYAYDILDTPVDSLFDGVAELAATLCGTPFAAVTLIDRDRQWFKAEHGMGVGQSDIPRDHSLCAHAILQETYFEVPDLSLDERFIGNPTLNGEVKIRFYGGSQLTTDNGATLGMLCVMDLQPRLLSAAQQRALSQLSHMVMALLATSKRNRQLHDSRALLGQRSAELVSANLFLDSMIEHIPAAVYIKEATQLRYVRVNRAAEEMMGMRRDEVIGKGAAELFGQPQADILEEQDRQVAVNNPAFESVDQLISSRRGVRVLHTRKVPVSDAQGELTHILGIAEDVTRQKAMQAEILELNAVLQTKARDLEALNRSLEVFSAAATHDLRAPLGVIAGYAGLLQKKYGPLLDDKGRGWLSVIGGRAKSMAQLIDDLLAFSKLGHRAVSTSAVDMQALVQSVAAELQPDTAVRTPIQLGQLPPARADAALLRQVWVNLLSNAIKYSSRAPDPLVEVSGRTEGAELIYTVRDNGAGFDMASYDKLFAVFERLHTDQEFEGTGIGLPIVHRIVTQHGGRVWAESRVGHGAVFHFALPVPAQDAPETHETREGPSGA